MALKEDPLEDRHFIKVLETFRDYSRHSKKRLNVTQNSLQSLPSRHQKLLDQVGYAANLAGIEKAIDGNYGLVKQFIEGNEEMFINRTHCSKSKEDTKVETSAKDVELIHSVLKAIARDWSEEGKEERDQSYQPILDEIESIFGHLNLAQKKETSILVPGAGLGRLAFEIAMRGYVSTGNDFSLYMLIASNFVLNKSKQKNEYTFYPWVHQYCNNTSAKDQIRPVTFPDISPSTSLSPDANFSMIAGDFLEVYSGEDYLNSQDCVVTCFFIDTAHNVVEYIEQIYKVLKVGGIWINLGPLLYHFADSARESSIEPSYDILRSIIEQSNFEFVREDTCKANYCQNSKSMFQFYYDCVFFTCKKK